MEETADLVTTNRKALTINLDAQKYGTFAEVGAGQEVARYFFQAGAAAGTVAKSISAYDMKFSDEIYGKCKRYTSAERLDEMLSHEYDLLVERLQETRAATSTFFVFADTVTAKSFKGNNECHGWMGVRFQTHPGGEANDVIIHVRMWDKENILQQQALGVIGVNLIYGAFYHRDDTDKFITALLDGLSVDRIEVDMIKFRGPEFHDVDNRLLSLKLVQHGLTNAVMFGPEGVMQPSEVLYKKAILVERGSFRPITHLHLDMLRAASAQFVQEPEVSGREIVVLMELTMHNLLVSGEFDPVDFLARVDTISAIGNNVLISNYSEYYRLASYFRRYTKEMIGIALGVNNLHEVFDEKYYDNLEGGILESFGRLFRHAVKLYVYPMKQGVYNRYLDNQVKTTLALSKDVLITAKNLRVTEHLENLYQHLMENHYIEPLAGYDEQALSIFPRDLIENIQADIPGWESALPPKVAELIKARCLFGFKNCDSAANR